MFNYTIFPELDSSSYYLIIFDHCNKCILKCHSLLDAVEAVALLNLSMRYEHQVLLNISDISQVFGEDTEEIIISAA